MKTKYVCEGLISLHVIFHDNCTMTTVIKFTEFAGGGKRKRAKISSLKKSFSLKTRKKDFFLDIETT